MAQEQQFFVSPSKLNIKGDKIIRKENLRKVPNKKIIQSSEEEGLEEEVKAKRKATKWWNKLNSKYFHHLQQQQVSSFKNQLNNKKIQQKQKQSFLNKLGTFFQEEITVINPNLLMSNTLRLLFRRQIKLDQKQQYILISYALSNDINSNQSEQKMQIQDQVQQKKPEFTDSELLEQIDKNIHLLSFKNLSKKNINLSKTTLQSIKIEPMQIQDREQVIFNLLKYETSKRQTNNQIQRQIKMWQHKLQKIGMENMMIWKNLIQHVKNNQKTLNQIKWDKQMQKEDAGKIKQELLWSQILLYIKLGHSDKTQQMLNGAMEVMVIKEMNMKQSQRKSKITKIQKLKCLFQTDCKICFCTQSDDKNKVFYCDKCNTSFHQSCYGIKNDQIESGKPFLCEVCQFLIEQEQISKNKIIELQNDGKIEEQVKFRKPRCQICTNTSFPMKKMNYHFYHVTCLFLFGYVKVQNYKLQLKQNVTHAKIIQQVIQNQIQAGPCQFCSKFSGIKFKCSYFQCQTYYHPICAYLNGSFIDIKRNYRSLQTSITCSNHIANRNIIHQIYIRRFFCDYKNTSNTSQEDFKISYEKQIEEREAFKQKQRKKQNKLIKKWKMVKIKIAKNDLELQKQKSLQMDIQQEKNSGEINKKRSAQTLEQISQLQILSKKI